MSRRRILTTGVGGIAGVVLGVALLLGGEVLLAGRGPRVVEFDPHLADGIIEPESRPRSGAADALADAAPLRVVWLGDSTAAGVGASAPHLGVAVQVARSSGRRTQLENRAVSGARVAEVVEQATGLPADTDLVVISVGANDATHLTGEGDFRRSYEQVLAAIPAGPAVVLLGVPALGTVTTLAQPLRWLAGVQGRRYGAVVEDLAASRGVGYVDIAGHTGPAFAADPDRNLAADHYHPSDAGYGLWRDAVLPVVEAAVAGR